MELRRIGKYEIVAELGQGGFGTVYRAYDASMRRQVAVKILASAREPELLARFRSEAGTTGSLSHKNIVTVYDYGELDGSPFLVMELLEGKNLKQLIEDNPSISLYEKIQIIKQVAEGLLYAHKHGVIHRDVKPANVMALPDGTVKIMDFGIARMTTQSGPRHTMQGMLVGTMQYMSPDQFKGHDADVLTDIFAFGVLCYEFLAGRHPFQSEHLTNTIYLITECNPPLLRTIVPDMPESVEAMVHRALAKNRELRYPSLDDVLFDTESILLDFRHDQATRIMQEAEALVSQGRTEEALKRLREVLELDSAHREAHALRRKLQSAIQRESVQNQVRSLLTEGEEHLQARRYMEAVRAFSSILQLEPQHERAKTLLDESYRRQESQESVIRYLTNAKQAAQRAQWADALEHAARAASADSSSDEARTLVAQYTQELDQERDRERKGRAKQQHDQIVVWIRDERFDEAQRALDSLSPRDAEFVDARSLQEKLNRQRGEAERRQRVQALRDRTANALSAEQAGRFEEAIPLWEALVKDYPAEPENVQGLNKARERLEQRRRAESLGRLRREAQGRLDNHRYPEVIEMARNGLREYGADEVLDRLLKTAEARQEQIQRDKARADALAQAQLLQSKEDHVKAMAVLTEALRQNPNDPALLAALQESRRQTDQRQYREELDAVLQEGKRLLAQGQPMASFDYLERVRERFGADPAFKPLHAAAAAARAAREEEDFAGEALAWSAEKRDAGQLEAAAEILRPALGRYPQNAALAKAALDVRNRIADEQRVRQVDGMAKSIATALAARDWNAAGQTLREFEERAPLDKRLPEWKREIEQGRRVDQLAILAPKIRECWQDEDLAKADALLNESRSALSFEPEFQALQKEQKQRRESRKLQDQAQKKEQQSRQERLRRLRGDAEQKRRKGQLAEALLVLDELCRDFPGERDLADLRQAVKAEADQAEKRRQEEQKRNARIAEGREKAAELVKAGRPSEAVTALEKLLKELPSQDLEKDLDAAKRAVEDKRKAEEAQQIARHAEGLMQQGNLATAVEVLQTGVRNHAGDAALTQLLNQAQSRLSEEQRRQALAQAKDQVGKLRADGSLTEAAAELDKTIQIYSDDTELKRMQREVEKEAAEQGQRRAQALEELRQLGRKLKGKVAFAELDRATYRVSELSSPYLGDSEVQNEADSVRRKIDDLLRSDEKAASSIPARGLTETVAVKTREPEPVIEAPRRQTPPIPLPPTPSPARKYGIWGAVAAAVLGIGYWAVSRPSGTTSGTVEVHTQPAGARVEVSGQTCTAPPCKFPLAAGSYEVRATLDGYAPSVQRITVDPKNPAPPLEIALQPLPSVFQVSTNWTGGTVSLDGRNAGQLRDGQYTIPNLAPGLHTLEIRGEDGKATLKVNAGPAQTPVITDLQAGGIKAVAVASMGRQVRVLTGTAGETVSLDGASKGTASKDGLSISDLSVGAHKLQIGDGDQKREVSLTVQPEPEAQLFLASNRDVGAVLIDASEENAVILLDNKRLDRLTAKAPVQLLLDTKPHLIEVQKNGFQPLPAQRVSARKNGVERLSFRLLPLPTRLQISDALPDTHVLIDGKEIGVVQGNGILNAPPGQHTIQLTKPGYAPSTFQQTFEPGGTVRLAKNQVRLTQLQKPPDTNGNGGTGGQTVDPRAQEAKDWEQVQNSRNLAALEEFRRTHSGSAYAQQAAQRIDQLEWDAVKASTDTSALRSFASAHPNSQFAAAALKQADQIDWGGVNRQDIASLRAYLQKNPNGAGAQQAQTELARLEQLERQRLEAERRRLEGEQGRKNDAQQIQQALSRLSAAYAAKDDKAIARAWPGMPAKSLSTLKDSFKATKSISLTFTPTGEPEITNDTATIICRRELRQFFKQEAPPKIDTVQVGLKRGAGSWAIESITAQ